MSSRWLGLVTVLALLLIAGLASAFGPRSSLRVEPFTSHERSYAAQSLWGVKWDTGTYSVRYLARPPWMEGFTGEGVRVAVVDTGVDGNHPDLKGKIVAWRDFLHGEPEPYDDDDHGTHVAGIIAGKGHWQLDPLDHYFPGGARGVAPDVELIVAKAMDSLGEGTPDTVADAINWAVDPNGDGDLRDGAHVINLSIGIELPGGGTLPAIPGLPQPTSDPCRNRTLLNDPGLQRICTAINRAVDRGVVVVVAAGNHEPGQGEAITFPGTMSTVVTVGALDADGDVAGFSNVGNEQNRKPDVVAPGVIVSTFPKARDTDDGRQDGYIGLGGTSMAAPVVTGTIALMMESSPELKEKRTAGGLTGKVATIRDVLRTTASHPNDWDPESGYGQLDAHAAVEWVDDGRGTGTRFGFVVFMFVVLAIGGWRVSRRVRANRRRQRIRLRYARVAKVARPAIEARDVVPAALAASGDELVTTASGRRLKAVRQPKKIAAVERRAAPR